MALWIKAKPQPNGFKVEMVHPARGEYFTVLELRSFVGGDKFDQLRLNDGHIMWLNHQRNQLNLPLNSLANTIAHEESGMPHAEVITGDVLLTNLIEAGEEQKHEGHH